MPSRALATLRRNPSGALLAVYIVGRAEPQDVKRRLEMWWRREDSNLRHGAYETPALPPELRRLDNQINNLQQRRILPRPGRRSGNCAWRAGWGRGRAVGGRADANVRRATATDGRDSGLRLPRARAPLAAQLLRGDRTPAADTEGETVGNL
jgi:hypothetical protein